MHAEVRSRLHQQLTLHSEAGSQNVIFTLCAQVNGNTYGPFPLDNTGAFTGTFPAPTTVGPYTVTVPYAPGPGFLAPSPPFSFPITVTNGGGGQTPTISQNVTPTQPPAGSPVTVTGTVTGPTGTPGAGTVDIKVTIVYSPSGAASCQALRICAGCVFRLLYWAFAR